MKVFITGATGFTGSRVVPLLLKNGYEVRCLYRASSDRFPLDGLDIDWALGDVSASRTVGQIMSRRPLLLSPQTPATEAALLMQKYGYEGYPVVENGKVIGLLTRRAVDRALTHNLDLPASSLMEAGEVISHPAEPLENLQQTMSTSGWGQVPVVDPQSGLIVGIVTRTDLLKTLSLNGEAHHKRPNLAEKLEAALPPVRLALLKLIAAESF